MTKTDESIIEYYQSKTLHPAHMQALLAETDRVRPRYVIPLAVAAAMLLMVLATQMHRYTLISEKTNVALQEAAMNHKTKLQMDFEIQDLKLLTASMGKLPFELQLPAESVGKNMNLVGARYCTIRGKLAAHLRFSATDSDEQLSLFMTPVQADLENMSSESEPVEGVHVRLWQENGLFYALADSSKTL